MNYYVKSTLNHDNREYRSGEVIELDETSKSAAALLAAGVIATDPAAPAAPQAAPAPQEPDHQPEVGGNATDTGEPSLDGRDDQNPSTGGTDVTPTVHEIPLDRMNRAQLDQAARAAGIPEDQIAAAETKKVMIDLILVKTKEAEDASNADAVTLGVTQPETPKPAEEPSEPEVDPSANL